MNDIMKLVQALEDSNSLLKGVTKTIKKGKGKGTVRAGEGIYGSSIKKTLIPAHPITNFEIKEYYESEPTFHGVYSRDNLAKTIRRVHM